MQLMRGIVITFQWHKIDYEVVFDGEDGVRGEVGVVFGEDLSGAGTVR